MPCKSEQQKICMTKFEKCSTFTIRPRFEVKLFSCKSKKIP